MLGSVNIKGAKARFRGAVKGIHLLLYDAIRGRIARPNLFLPAFDSLEDSLQDGE